MPDRNASSNIRRILKIRKGKSHGFRVWYCLKKDEIYFCLFEDAGEKVKEKSTQYHIARIREVMKEDSEE